MKLLLHYHISHETEIQHSKSQHKAILEEVQKNIISFPKIKINKNRSIMICKAL